MTSKRFQDAIRIREQIRTAAIEQTQSMNVSKVRLGGLMLQLIENASLSAFDRSRWMKIRSEESDS